MEALAVPVDIFATKGIEYLLFLLFLGAFLTLWLMFTSDRERTVKVRGTKNKNLMNWFSVPEGIFFHLGHSWARAESAGTLRVGMDDFAQKMIGAVDSVRTGKAGEKLRQGEEGWILKMENRSIAMLSPVNGEILEVNKEVLADPSLIHNDPYGKGWLLKVKAEDFVRDRRNLLSEKPARKWMEGVTEQLSYTIQFLNLMTMRSESAECGPVCQDGSGPFPTEGIARRIDNDNWCYHWNMLLEGFFLSNEERQGRNLAQCLAGAQQAVRHYHEKVSRLKPPSGYQGLLAAKPENSIIYTSNTR